MLKHGRDRAPARHRRLSAERPYRAGRHGCGEAQAMAAAHPDGMADCHGPAEKKQTCKIDCALCHAVAPAAGVPRVVSVTSATLTPAEPSAWTEWSPEVEPPVPRSVS